MVSRSTGDLRPALLTGTSSEFVGGRALPRLVRDRALIVVLGPAGVGKSTVARRLAGDGAAVLGVAETRAALVHQVGRGAWAPELVAAPTLVLDGPSWLRSRPAAADALLDLIQQRMGRGGRTIVVQLDEDASMDVVWGRLPVEATAVVGLRFPKGDRGRRRAAHRLCEAMGLPTAAAKGTWRIEPWSYAAVRAALADRAQG